MALSFQYLCGKLLSEKLDLIENSKNKRTQNLKIPHIYKKGDLFYELINTWNNLPPDIKIPPAKLFISKKRIKAFIQSEYKPCEKENCKSCEVTNFELMITVDGIQHFFNPSYCGIGIVKSCGIPRIPHKPKKCPISHNIISKRCKFFLLHTLYCNISSKEMNFSCLFRYKQNINANYVLYFSIKY